MEAAAPFMALPKRLSRLPQARFLPLLLLLPFLIGLLSVRVPAPAAPPPYLPFARGRARACQPRLLVDTPPSAGLSALHHALSRLLPAQAVALCRAPAGCADLLRAVCNASAPPPAAIVGFLHADAHTLACLRTQKGYYAAVAARDPLDRWSAEYVRAAPSKPYLDWMAAYPDCSLLHYFDDRGPVCADDDDVVARVQDVATRFDEGIDVYAGKGDRVYARVRRLLGEAVKLDRPSKKFRSFLGRHRLRAEGWLYDAIAGVRPPEDRALC